MAGTQDATPLDAGAQPGAHWGQIALSALKAWKGDTAGLATRVDTLAKHELLPERHPGRVFLVAFHLSGAIAGSGTLIAPEAATRTALGLAADAPLTPALQEFIAALGKAQPAGPTIEIGLDSEQCIELTAATLPSLRTALPVEPMSAIDADVSLGGGEPVRVGVLLHPKRLRLDQEMRGLAEMGVGRDSHAAGSASPAGAEDDRLALLMDVDLPLIVRLGEAELRLDELLALRPGSVIELNKMVDEPAELIVNNKVLAYGEIVVVHEKFGIRIERLAGEAAGILA